MYLVNISMLDQEFDVLQIGVKKLGGSCECDQIHLFTADGAKCTA